MKKKRWDTINEIVDRAMDLEEGNRTEYISSWCGGNKQLKDQVTELLSSIKQSETECFLENPKNMFGNLAEDLSIDKEKPADSSMVGKTIVNYRIIELIEHGGMGSVFMAERTDGAYQKKVALKLLQRGMDTPSNIARFKRERNILADLDHPNITHLLDGGITQEGLPFLVMDYVDGTPLLDYCDTYQRTIQERLELFKTIGKAVQHAHKNAIIHRDLKPSNILVTDEGKVKLLDFGIAELARDEDSLSQSDNNSRILTLKYAAPEQLTGQSITTATDTYALGILLYELLAGVYPFDFKRMKIGEMEDIIKHELPAKPSERVNDLPKEDQKEIAENRETNPDKLVKKLTGDLDAIVLKCLQKEPEYRYSSVEKLLDDIEQIGKHMPVSAREPTLGYKASKFFYRRRKEIAVAAVFVIVVTGILAFHTIQINKERNIAQQEARRADEVSSFLLELFDTNSNQDTLSAAGLLQQGMEHLRGLENSPAHTNMLSVMGQAYMNFGDYEKAEELLLEALAETRQIYGEESIEYVTALYRNGLLHERRYEWEDAVNYFRESFNLQSKILGDFHSKTAGTLSRLSLSLRNTGQLEEAEQSARKAVDIHEEMFEPTHTERIHSLANLAYVLRERGKTEEAESIYLQVIDRAENNPQVKKKVLATFYNNLGYLYRTNDEYDKAVKSYRNALAYEKESYVEGHPDIVNTRKNLATTLYFQDSLRQAELYFKENVTAIREKYSNTHWRTASAMNSLGLFYLENKRYEDAEPFLRESTHINREVLGDNHLWTAYTEGLLAACLKFQRKESALADSLYKHHVNLYRNHQNDFDNTHKNQLNRLARIHEKHNSTDSTYVVYQELLR